MAKYKIEKGVGQNKIEKVIGQKLNWERVWTLHVELLKRIYGMFYLELDNEKSLYDFLLSVAITYDPLSNILHFILENRWSFYLQTV